MFVEQILPRARERLATIDAEAPVREAADLMARPHTDLVVVCDQGGRMVGVLTKTDIVGQIRQCSGCSCTARVETIMTRSVIPCGPGEALQAIWSVIKKHGVQRVPVVGQDGRPIGVIYARDALQVLLGEVEDEESLLRDYVMNIGYR